MENAREVLETAHEAWNRRDAERFASLADAELRITAPGGRERNGIDGWREHYHEWMQAFPDNIVTRRAIVCDGDEAIAQLTFTGTHLGTMHSVDGDVPPTGKRVNMDLIEVVHTSQGKVASIRFFYDRVEIMSQLGLLAATATSRP